MSATSVAATRAIGAEWAGPIPASWNVARLGHVARVFAGGTPDRNVNRYWEDGTIPWLSSGEVNQWLIEKPTTYITEDGMANSSARWIPQGALVLALAGQGKTKGMVAQLGFAATCNQSLAAIVPSDRVHARYLLWWLTANYDTLRHLTGGDQREGLNLEILRSLPCPLPGIDTQSAIADLLDRETARIDGLLGRNERLIDLLNERQSAAITSAVSGALTNSPVKSKSGLDWVGDLPTSWSVVPLKALGRGYIGLTYDPRDIVSPDHPNAVAVLRAGNVQQGRLDLDDLLYVGLPVPESDRIRKGDILLCARSGSATLVGKSVYIDHDLRSTTWGAFMTVFRSAHNDYLKWIFWSELFKAEISRFQTTTINQLTHETLHGLRIPLPPAEERLAISRRLSDSVRASQQLLNKTNSVAELLRERRKAFITAAVSGQLSAEDVAS